MLEDLLVKEVFNSVFIVFRDLLVSFAFGRVVEFKLDFFFF